MAQPDRLRLTGIRIEATHGVYAHEKQNPQPFLIDVLADLAQRPVQDDLSTTVDYSVLAGAIAAAATRESVDLIETLAERVAATCLADHRIEEVEVTVHKPQAPMPVTVGDVSVTITRRRPQ